MPNVPVSTTPVQISQTVTQAANLQNTGNVTVYLDDNTAVSVNSYGMAVPPLSSVGWPAERDLWAVTEAGDGMLSVLYGASGVTQSEVTAVVTGDVTATISGPVDVTGNVNANITNATIDATVTGNIVVDSGTIQVGGIDTPVMVQGGGEELYAISQSIAAGATFPFSIPAPPSGLTYFGLSVFFQSSGSSLMPLSLALANNGPGFAGGIDALILGSTAPASHLGTIGLRQRLQFTVPMASEYPITGSIYNPGSGAKTATFQVNGIAQSQAYPLDVGEWTLGNDASISFNAAALNSVAIIAPSFTTRRFLFTTTTASAGAIVVEAISNDVVPVWYTTQTAPFNNLAGGNTGTAALVPNTVSEILIPGTGRPHRIRVSTAIVGDASLSYAGTV